MNIFESLENLNVSEECFNDIIDIVEELIAEDLDTMLNLPRTKFKELYDKYKKNLKGRTVPGKYGPLKLKGKVPSGEDMEDLYDKFGNIRDDGSHVQKNPNKYAMSSPIEDKYGPGKKILDATAGHATNKSLKKKGLEGVPSTGTQSSYKESGVGKV